MLSKPGAEPETRNTGSHLVAIDVLRGLACLWVVLYHLDIERFAQATAFFHRFRLDAIPLVFWSWAEMGFQGVTLFLLLSGFCLAYPLARRGPLASTPTTPFLPFFRRRAERILPPYYVALAVWAAVLSLPTLAHVPGADFTMGNLLAKILMIHNLNPSWVYGINDSFWSLALEMQLYCLFPTLLATIRQNGLKGTLLMAFVFSLGWQWYSSWIIGGHPPFNEGVPWFFSFAGRLFPFVLGVACAEWVARPWPGQVQQARLALTLLLPLCAGGGLAQGTYPFRLGSDALWSVTFVAALLCLVRVSEPALLRGVAGGLVRPLAALGTVSYSVYLWHQPLLRIAVTLQPDLCRASFVATVTLLGTILLVGVAAYALIEKPLLAYRKQSRKTPPLPTESVTVGVPSAL